MSILKMLRRKKVDANDVCWCCNKRDFIANGMVALSPWEYANAMAKRHDCDVREYWYDGGLVFMDDSTKIWVHKDCLGLQKCDIGNGWNVTPLKKSTGAKRGAKKRK